MGNYKTLPVYYDIFRANMLRHKMPHIVDKKTFYIPVRCFYCKQWVIEYLYPGLYCYCNHLLNFKIFL